jgi:hypothetical protein
MAVKFLMFLFLILSLNAFGQDNREPDGKNWKIGISVMPSILTNHKTSREMNFSLPAGIQYERKVSGRLSLMSGLTYLRTNLYHGAWHGAFCDNPLATCYIYSTTDLIEIPLTVKLYYLEERQKANPYISFGIVNSFSIKDEDKRVNVGKDYYHTTYFHNNRFHYQQSLLSVSFGTDLRITERLELND